MNQLKLNTHFKNVLNAFGFEIENSTITPVKNGLINYSFIIDAGHKKIFLQKINRQVFTSPADIVENYLKLFTFNSTENILKLPAPIPTLSNIFYLEEGEKEFWRALEFIDNTSTLETAKRSEEVHDAAFCFGNFTKVFSEFDVSELKIIIPRFHDLEFRFHQFRDALSKENNDRLRSATYEIEQLMKRKPLVDFFKQVISDSDYKLRVMHHDAKLSNILFDSTSNKVICPVDLDTTQAGYYFSDLGDMIRSMASTLPENSTNFSAIDINPKFYNAILDGYTVALKNELTNLESKNIHYSGLLMIYMQSLRYLTDYLNGDVYYQISYPEQNFDRARNQLMLILKLEEFLLKEYHFKS